MHSSSKRVRRRHEHLLKLNLIFFNDRPNVLPPLNVRLFRDTLALACAEVELFVTRVSMHQSETCVGGLHAASEPPVSSDAVAAHSLVHTSGEGKAGRCDAADLGALLLDQSAFRCRR